MRLTQIFKKRSVQEDMARTGAGHSAVIGWGRGMGHKGHMYLASSVITQAKEQHADPYFVVSRTVGKDDPITPDEKLAIYRKVFPQSGHIFQTATDDMPDLTRVLANLYKQGYTSATVVVGADQKAALSYVKNYNGKPDKAGNIPFNFRSLNVISRQETSDPSASQEGPRATPMRDILKDPAATEEEKFAVWRDAMNPELSDSEVRDLMHKAETRMKAAVPVKKVKVSTENDDLRGIQSGGKDLGFNPGYTTTSAKWSEGTVQQNDTYTVEDFQRHNYRDFGALMSRMMQPKSNKRHTTESWPTAYERYLFPDQTIVEATDVQELRSQADELRNAIRALDQRDTVKIAVGEKFAVLYAAVALDHREIEFGGFTDPRTIAYVGVRNGRVDFVEFDNGEQFPEKAELADVGGKNLMSVAFFNNGTAAESAYTALWFKLGNLEGHGWHINNQLKNSTTESKSQNKLVPIGPQWESRMGQLIKILESK